MESALRGCLTCRPGGLFPAQWQSLDLRCLCSRSDENTKVSLTPDLISKLERLYGRYSTLLAEVNTATSGASGNSKLQQELGKLHPVASAFEQYQALNQEACTSPALGRQLRDLIPELSMEGRPAVGAAALFR